MIQMQCGCNTSQVRIGYLIDKDGRCEDIYCMPYDKKRFLEIMRRHPDFKENVIDNDS